VITRTPNSLSPVSTTPPTHSGLDVLWWTLLAFSVGLVAALVAIIWRHRRRWSPEGRTPEQMALLARDEVERALRRARVDHPPWQPLDLFFEEMSRTESRSLRREAVTPPGSQRSGCPDALVTDGFTVARIVDEALFGPEPISAKRGFTAYEAARRMRDELTNVGASRSVTNPSTNSQ
jgi:hypothetical protein